MTTCIYTNILKLCLIPGSCSTCPQHHCPLSEPETYHVVNILDSKDLEVWFQNLDPKLANSRMVIVPTLSEHELDHAVNILQCGGYIHHIAEY